MDHDEKFAKNSFKYIVLGTFLILSKVNRKRSERGQARSIRKKRNKKNEEPRLNREIKRDQEREREREREREKERKRERKTFSTESSTIPWYFPSDDFLDVAV